MVAQVEIIPHGRTLMTDAGITGFLPALKSVPGPIESLPVNTNAGTADQKSRVKLAQDVHSRREGLKLRTCSLAKMAQCEMPDSPPPRLPTPPRTPLSNSGNGGDYYEPDAAPASPQVPAVDLKFKRANLAAWASEPVRLA
jgi:hypothetical protein